MEKKMRNESKKKNINNALLINWKKLIYCSIYLTLIYKYFIRIDEPFSFLRERYDKQQIELIHIKKKTNRFICILFLL